MRYEDLRSVSSRRSYRSVLNLVHSHLLLITKHRHATRIVFLSMRLPLDNRLDLGIQARLTWLCVPWPWSTLAEEDFDFLQGFTAGFRIAEEGLSGSAHAENTEYDEGLVSDVRKAGGVNKPRAKLK